MTPLREVTMRYNRPMRQISLHLSLLAILLLGGYLRYRYGQDIPFWHDEAFSALMSQLPLSELLTTASQDFHPPGYYLLLKGWSMLWGDSIFALRSMSLMFGVLGIWAGYLFTRAAFHHTGMALTAALFLAVNPFQVAYGIEARMYTLGVCAALMASYFLIRIALSKSHHERTWRRSGVYLGFMGACILAIYTHYYLLFTVVGMLGVGWFALWRKYRFSLLGYLPFLFTQIGIIAAYIPWIPHLAEQFSRVHTKYWIQDMHLTHIPGTLWNMVLGIPTSVHNFKYEALETSASLNTFFGHELTDTWNGTPAVFALLVVGTLWLLVSLFRKGGIPGGILNAHIVAPFLGATIFSCIAKMTGSTSSVYFDRYFIFAGSALIIALAWWVFRPTRSIFTTLGILIITGTSLFALHQYHTHFTSSNSPGMAGVMKYLEAHPQRETPIIIATTLQFTNYTYYATQYRRAPLGVVHLYTPGVAHKDDLLEPIGPALKQNTILTPSWDDAGRGREAIWVLWSDGFGDKAPVYPSTWTRVERTEFNDVRPEGATIFLDYLITQHDTPPTFMD